jgi:FMN-dependent NADH-azoreductase
MQSLLHVSASPRGDASFSRRYGQNLVAALQANAVLDVVERDLNATPLPYPNAMFATSSLKTEAERSAAEIDALSLSECLIAELEIADLVVIDTPIHNFTLPAALKTWIDYVVRPARTFRSGPQGKLGLLQPRPVYLIIACGGIFGEGGQTDFLTPYLRHVLATIGLTDVEALRLEGFRRGEVAEERAHACAMNWITSQRQRHKQQ